MGDGLNKKTVKDIQVNADKCTGRHTYTISGKTYSKCGFCRVACPSRKYFIEPYC